MLFVSFCGTVSFILFEQKEIRHDIQKICLTNVMKFLLNLVSNPPSKKIHHHCTVPWITFLRTTITTISIMKIFHNNNLTTITRQQSLKKGMSYSTRGVNFNSSGILILKNLPVTIAAPLVMLEIRNMSPPF